MENNPAMFETTNQLHVSIMVNAPGNRPLGSSMIIILPGHFMVAPCWTHQPRVHHEYMIGYDRRIDMDWLFSLTVVNGSRNIVKPQAYSWRYHSCIRTSGKGWMGQTLPRNYYRPAWRWRCAVSLSHGTAHVSQRVPHQQSHHCSSMNLSRDHVFWQYNWSPEIHWHCHLIHFKRVHPVIHPLHSS